MHLRSLRPDAGGARSRVRQAESVLVEQYGDLVRLAHLVLPASLGRHQRVLVAHSLVQRALRHARATHTAPAVPSPREESRAGDTVERRLLVEVVRAALTYGRRPRLWPAGWVHPGALRPGCRWSGGCGCSRVRAGWTNSPWHNGCPRPPPRPARRSCCVPSTVFPTTPSRTCWRRRTRRTCPPPCAPAGILEEESRRSPAALLASQEFDACALQAGPTDLLRRTRRARLVLGVAALGLVTAVTLAVADDGTTHRTASQVPTAHGIPSTTDLVRTAAGTWDNTSRVDFTAWPARGSRAHDRSLLDRALSAWTHPRIRITLAPATTATPPVTAPQLLYAGNLDDRAVVLLYDGQRLARYSETRSAARDPELSVARADDADVTTAAAVTLTPAGSTARYLLAPWVAEAETRDLLHPDVLARALHVSKDGVTDRVPTIPASENCDNRPVLQLRSSERIAEHHAFLLAPWATCPRSTSPTPRCPGTAHRPPARPARPPARRHCWPGPTRPAP